MMSQLGCVTLPPETIEAVYSGEKLSANEQAQYDAHPSVAYDLLSKIPRLEPIAWMIEHQNRPVREVDDSEKKDMRLGAEILRLTLAYEKLIHKGDFANRSGTPLTGQNKNFSPEFFDALVELDPNAEEGEIRKCRIEELAARHDHPTRMSEPARETLLVSKGQEVTRRSYPSSRTSTPGV
jgi:hypothetical protein